MRVLREHPSNSLVIISRLVMQTSGGLDRLARTGSMGSGNGHRYISYLGIYSVRPGLFVGG